MKNTFLPFLSFFALTISPVLAGTVTYVEDFSLTPQVNDTLIEMETDSGSMQLEGGQIFSPIFDSDPESDGSYLGLAGDNGPSKGHLIYRFRAPVGEVFSGMADIDVRMGAQNLHQDSWGSVRVTVDSQGDPLAEVSTRDPESNDAGKSEPAVLSKVLQFDATGAEEINVRFDLETRFYTTFNAQLAYFKFRANTVKKP